MSNMDFEQRRRTPLELRMAVISELQASYMPYMRHGGIFIAGGQGYRLGEPVSASLSLAGHFEQVQVHGEVAWITPPGAQGNRMAGVGIHFSRDETTQAVRQLIEGLLTHDELPVIASYTV